MLYMLPVQFSSLLENAGTLCLWRLHQFSGCFSFWLIWFFRCKKTPQKNPTCCFASTLVEPLTPQYTNLISPLSLTDSVVVFPLRKYDKCAVTKVCLSPLQQGLNVCVICSFAVWGFCFLYIKKWLPLVAAKQNRWHCYWFAVWLITLPGVTRTVLAVQLKRLKIWHLWFSCEVIEIYHSQLKFCLWQDSEFTKSPPPSYKSLTTDEKRYLSCLNLLSLLIVSTGLLSVHINRKWK